MLACRVPLLQPTTIARDYHRPIGQTRTSIGAGGERWVRCVGEELKGTSSGVRMRRQDQNWPSRSPLLETSSKRNFYWAMPTRFDDFFFLSVIHIKWHSRGAEKQPCSGVVNEMLNTSKFLSSSSDITSQLELSLVQFDYPWPWCWIGALQKSSFVKNLLPE